MQENALLDHLHDVCAHDHSILNNAVYTVCVYKAFELATLL